MGLPSSVSEIISSVVAGMQAPASPPATPPVVVAPVTAPPVTDPAAVAPTTVPIASPAVPAATDDKTVAATETAEVVIPELKLSTEEASVEPSSGGTDPAVTGTPTTTGAVTATSEPADVTELKKHPEVQKYLSTDFAKQLYQNHRQFVELTKALSNSGLTPLPLEQLARTVQDGVRFERISNDVVTGDDAGAGRLFSMVFGPIVGADGRIEVDTEGNRQYYPAAEKVADLVATRLEKYNPGAFDLILNRVAANPEHVTKVIEKLTDRIGENDPGAIRVSTELAQNFYQSTDDSLAAQAKNAKSPERRTEIQTARKVLAELANSTVGGAQRMVQNLTSNSGKESAEVTALKAKIAEYENSQKTSRQQQQQSQSSGRQKTFYTSVEDVVGRDITTLTTNLETIISSLPDETRAILRSDIRDKGIAIASRLEKHIKSNPVYQQQILSLGKQFVATGNEALLRQAAGVLQSIYTGAIHTEYKTAAEQLKQMVLLSNGQAHRAHAAVQDRTGPGAAAGTSQPAGVGGGNGNGTVTGTGHGGKQTAYDITRAVAASMFSGKQ